MATETEESKKVLPPGWAFWNKYVAARDGTYGELKVIEELPAFKKPARVLKGKDVEVKIAEFGATILSSYFNDLIDYMEANFKERLKRAQSEAMSRVLD